MNIEQAPLLVVDDKEENLFSFRKTLTQAGFSVETAHSGSEALRYLIKHPVSLILLDVQMPEMNGFEVAQIVRQRDELKDLPIIFISATQNTEEFIKHGYAVGAYEYLSKPIDNEILINKVRLFHTLYIQHKVLEERNRATEALNQALESNEVLKHAVATAEKASRAKDEFLASMSHELRTPLTSIIGNGELLTETSLSGYQSELLESMTISGKSLLYLINDILDTSKIEAGKFEIDHTAFDLSVLLRELHHIFTKRAEEAGLQFEIEQPDHPLGDCMGDGKRITQILVNLLGNAIKFTDQGRVTLSVTLDIAHAKIQFIVEDTGIGMSEEVVSRLFQPFEQADSSISSRFGGTGLGLYISSSLATLMSGTLSVESSPGNGSRFYLTLPLEFAENRVEVEIKEPELPHQPVKCGGDVLLAEDAPELQLLVRRMIEPFGVTVTLAGNGVEAVACSQARDYRLILMDMQMPEMDGVEATRVLRARGNNTPVVALTANVMESHRKQFDEVGGNGFLSKPVNREQLQAVIEQYCSVP